LKIFGPIERSSGASSAVLILDPCWSLSSFIGWQASCGGFVVPTRSKRGCLNFWVKLCPRAGRTRPAHPVNRERPARGPMGIAKSLARTDETIRRRAAKRRCRRPCTRRLHHGRTLALSPNVSCAFAVLTRPCLIAWAPMKRDYGARPRRRFGPSRRCDNRLLQSGSDCAIGSCPSPGIGKGRSRLTHSLGVERRDDDGCARGSSLRKSVEARQVIRLSAPARSARQYDSPGLG
jgi:hypothetical protein